MKLKFVSFVFFATVSALVVTAVTWMFLHAGRSAVVSTVRAERIQFALDKRWGIELRFDMGCQRIVGLFVNKIDDADAQEIARRFSSIEHLSLITPEIGATAFRNLLAALPRLKQLRLDFWLEPESNAGQFCKMGFFKPGLQSLAVSSFGMHLPAIRDDDSKRSTITSLTLDFGDYDALHQWLGRCALTSLTLENAQFKDIEADRFLEYVSTQRNMRSLTFYQNPHNYLPLIDLQRLVPLEHLQHLRFDHCRIDATRLAGLRDLKTLQLRDVSLSNGSLADVFGHSSLGEVTLWECRMRNLGADADTQFDQCLVHDVILLHPLLSDLAAFRKLPAAIHVTLGNTVIVNGVAYCSCDRDSASGKVRSFGQKEAVKLSKIVHLRSLTLNTSGLSNALEVDRPAMERLLSAGHLDAINAWNCSFEPKAERRSVENRHWALRGFSCWGVEDTAFSEAFVTPSLRSVILPVVPKTRSFRDAWKEVRVNRLGLMGVRVSPDVVSRLASGCGHVRRLWTEHCKFENGAYSDLIACCRNLEWLRLGEFTGREDSRSSDGARAVSKFAEYLSNLTVPTVFVGHSYVLQHELGPEWVTE